MARPRSRCSAGKAIRPLSRAQTTRPKLRRSVAAIAEASPYLWDLIRAEPDRFLALLEADPEPHFAALIADLTAHARRAG